MKIQQNYNRQSFTAHLDIYAPEEMINAREVKILKDITSKIGNELDSIHVNIGEKRYWEEDGEVNSFTGYSMAVATYIKGKLGLTTFEKHTQIGIGGEEIGGNLITPFETLKSFFEKLAK